jgi:hypothetical protein
MFRILDLVNGEHLEGVFKNRRHARIVLEMRLKSTWFHWRLYRHKNQFLIEEVPNE